jgi:hypothetical protein
MSTPEFYEGLIAAEMRKPNANLDLIERWDLQIRELRASLKAEVLSLKAEGLRAKIEDELRKPVADRSLELIDFWKSQTEELLGTPTGKACIFHIYCIFH